MTQLLNSKTIFLIDDDTTWLSFLARALPNPRMICLTSSSPTTALQVIERNKVDLVVTDTNMPQLDGVKLLAKIRANPDTANLPVVVFFDGLQGSPITRDDLYNLGATEVFRKSEILDFCHFMEEFIKRI